ncbi:MAG: hypothetical protein IKK83_05005 [Clostridia bacterium]|nr:hypothetical protein [Clostridia bacterium]
MKQTIAFALALLCVLSLVSCTSDFEDIARSEYELDRGTAVSDYDYSKGLGALFDRIKGVYEDNDDLTEYGRDIVEPLVEFDGALMFEGDEYDFPTRLFYYMMVEAKSGDVNNTDYVDATEAEAAVYWNSLLQDKLKTHKDYALEYGLEICRHALASMYAMDDLGFTETENYISSYNNIFSFFGNEQALNEYYAAYGLDSELLLQFSRYFTAYNELREYLIGTGGKYYPDEEELYSFYEEECIYMQQIVFSYVDYYPDGRIVYKSDEEIAAKRAEGKALYEQIVNKPVLFTRNMYRTEHPDWKENSAGYLYTPGEILPELETAYRQLIPGDITAVDTPLGYYIIQAVDKHEDIYTSNKDRISSALCNRIYEGLISPYYDCFVYNEAEYNRYKFEEILTY